MGRQWPLPNGTFTITSRFTGRINPVTGAFENHSGTDFAVPDGTPFYACAGGTVKFIGAASGYGQWIVIDHPDSEGGGCSEYGHMWNAFATGLKAGDRVEAGQRIGYVGSNGQSTGPHLHLTVWESAYGGKLIDPETWLAGKPYPGEKSNEGKVVGFNYYEVEPHATILTRSYTAGRGGRSIQYITRHHMAGNLNLAQCVNLWNGAGTSAHYTINSTGGVGQAVYDGNTAWSNGNSLSNQVSISIEHANTSTNGYPISDATIRAGARWAAALCLYYKLGRPVFGKNIRDHKEFSPTACPMHLANGGKYHAAWMVEAQSFYDKLVAKSVNPDGSDKAGGGSNIIPKEDELSGKTGTFILDQMVGPGKKSNGDPDWSGWKQLGGRTIVDYLAAMGQEITALRTEVADLKGGK